MAKQKPNFVSLNKVLPCQTGKKSKKRHTCTGSRNDAVSDNLAKCKNAEDVGHLAMRFGFTENDVRTRARAAKNFGLFRMVIGNLCRGVVSRIAAAKQAGGKLTAYDAAHPKEKKAKKVVKKKKKKAKKASK